MSFQNRIISLTNSNFVIANKSKDNNLENQTLLSKDDRCILVLFYSSESENSEPTTSLLKLWKEVASRVVGLIFAVYDVKSDNIHDFFANVKWKNITEYPFIIAYNKGSPISIYQGELEINSLIEYSLDIICKCIYCENGPLKE